MATESRRAKILIVDDEPGNVRLLERMLKLDGYVNLRSTSDSRQVVELCAAYQPDLVLLDLRMPGLNGLEVMRELRAGRPVGVGPAILLLTADAPAEVEGPARTAGAAGVLQKPLHLQDLLRAVGDALDD